MWWLWGDSIVEEYTMEDALHADARHTHRGLITVEMPQHNGCRDGGYAIGYGNAQPHSISAPNLGEDDEERYEEHELAADGEEDALLNHADALEEVACDNLEAHDGKHADNDTHARNGEGYQFLIFCEKHYGVSWEKLA